MKIWDSVYIWILWYSLTKKSDSQTIGNICFGPYSAVDWEMTLRFIPNCKGGATFMTLVQFANMPKSSQTIKDLPFLAPMQFTGKLKAISSHARSAFKNPKFCRYRQQVEGVSEPELEKHEMYLDLEPQLGAPVGIQIRFLFFFCSPSYSICTILWCTNMPWNFTASITVRKWGTTGWTWIYNKTLMEDCKLWIKAGSELEKTS